MVGMSASELLLRGVRQHAAGHYDLAIADYRDVAATPELARHGRERLTIALRELEVSWAAVEECRVELGEALVGRRCFDALRSDPGDGSAAPRRALAELWDGNNPVAPHLALAELANPEVELTTQDALDALVEVAEEAIDDFKLLIALPHLRRIEPRLRLMLAERLLAAGRLAEAKTEADVMVAVVPCFGPAYRVLGDALAGLRQGMAAARAYDCAAAFWNPGWWLLEFRRGMHMRVPGITVQGYDIYFWDDSFIAIDVDPRWRKLRNALLARLRGLRGIALTAIARIDRFQRALQRLLVAARRAVWRLRVFLPLPSRRPALRRLRRFPRWARRVRVLLWRRQTAARGPQRRWRDRLAFRFAQLELFLMQDASSIRAKTLAEILEAIERSARHRPA